MLDQLLTITRGFAHCFPEGNDPYQMMTRLLEESGELAQKVNHFEGSGIKREKYGQPDPQALAKEIKDVLICALQVAVHYGVEAELEATLALSYQRLKAEGHIPPETSAQ